MPYKYIFYYNYYTVTIYNKRSKDHTLRAPEAYLTILDLNGIGRRGFILLAVPDHDSPDRLISTRNEALLMIISSSSQLQLASKAISQPEIRSPTLVIIVFLARVDNVK